LSLPRVSSFYVCIEFYEKTIALDQ
jgi:hypothetical protein